MFKILLVIDEECLLKVCEEIKCINSLFENISSRIGSFTFSHYTPVFFFCIMII